MRFRHLKQQHRSKEPAPQVHTHVSTTSCWTADEDHSKRKPIIYLRIARIQFFFSQLLPRSRSESGCCSWAFLRLWTPDLGMKLVDDIYRMLSGGWTATCWTLGAGGRWGRKLAYTPDSTVRFTRAEMVC
jgi:hypothetical protein